jgi:hypothetical protein
MRIKLFIVIFFYSCGLNQLQKKVQHSANTDIKSLPYMNNYPFPVDFIISYSGEGYSGGLNWDLLSRENGKWYRVHCNFKPAVKPGDPHYYYTKADIDQKAADSAVKAMIALKIWNIKEKDEGCEKSEYTQKNKLGKTDFCTVSDGVTRVITFIAKERVLSKRYYEPELWERSFCCPGNKDRQVFIKCYNILKNAK